MITHYDRYKHVKGRSELIPNQVRSIREILNRSIRGQWMFETQANQLQFGEDSPEEDGLPGMEDKFDVLDHASYLEERVAQYNAAKAKFEADKAQKAAQAKQSEAQQADVADSAKNENNGA